MSKDSIPPYYEVARLLRPDDADTLKSCVKYRATPPPNMSLSWLRNNDYQILSGQLSIDTLTRAAEQNLPPKARPSVLKALTSLVSFAEQKAWLAERLPEFQLEVGRGVVMPIRASGRFHAADGRWVVGLQPRLDEGPDLVWQMQTWAAFLNEAFCLDPLNRAAPLILDCSRDKKTGCRGFHAIDPAILPLITRAELNRRMDSFIDCYKRATELVPVRPQREKKSRPDDSAPHLPGTGFD